MSIVRLAQDLGLSVSTVSRALNGYQDVARATRERVAQRAQELGYKPHPGARRLKAGSSQAIGVILPIDTPNGPFMDPMYAQLLGGIAAVTDTAGYSLLATAHGQTNEAHEIAQYETFVRSSWFDAFVVVRTRTNDARVNLLLERHIPFVTYGRTDEADRHAWVDTDNEGAFRLATQRLIGFGHSRIALLNGPAPFAFAQLRRRGFETALQQAGLPLVPEHCVHTELTETAGYLATRQQLALPRWPTALLCATDAMAIGAMAACRGAGLTVGRDISVIGYGNSDAGRYSDPSLTTIEHEVQTNGRHIGQLLLRLLNGTPAPGLHHLEPVALVARQSDGPCLARA